jgi:hypothetical protein
LTLIDETRMHETRLHLYFNISEVSCRCTYTTRLNNLISQLNLNSSSFDIDTGQGMFLRTLHPPCILPPWGNALVVCGVGFPRSSGSRLSEFGSAPNQIESYSFSMRSAGKSRAPSTSGAGFSTAGAAPQQKSVVSHLNSPQFLVLLSAYS